MAHVFNTNDSNKMASLQDNNQTNFEEVYSLSSEIMPTARASTGNSTIFYIAAGFIISFFIYVIILAFYPKLLLICCRKCRSAGAVPSRNESTSLEPKPSTSGTQRVVVCKADLNASPYEGDFDSDDEQPPSLESIREREVFCPVDYVDVSDGEQEEISMKNIESIPSEEEISMKNIESIPSEEEISMKNIESIPSEEEISMKNIESIPSEEEISMKNIESIPSEEEIPAEEPAEN